MNKDLMYRLIAAAIGILSVVSLVYDAKTALWIGTLSAVVVALIYLMRYTTGDEKNDGIKKMKSAASLVIVAIVIGILLYHTFANYLVSRWLMAPRTAVIVITVLLPLVITALWLIFKDVLPGDLSLIRRGSIAIVFVVVGIIGYSYFSVPNDLFDRKTGESKFWVDEDGEVYPSSGYSPKTRAVLRPGTPEDARKIPSSWNQLKQQQPQQKQKPQKKPVHTRLVTVGADWKKIALPSYVATDYRSPFGEILKVKIVDNGWEFEKTAEGKITYVGPHDFIEGDCGKIYYKGDDTGIYFGKRAFEVAAVKLASKSGREIPVEFLEWLATEDDPPEPYCGEQKTVIFNNPLSGR